MVYQPLIKLIFHSLSIIAIILLVTYLICSMINLKVGVKRLTPDYYLCTWSSQMIMIQEKLKTLGHLPQHLSIPESYISDHS